MRSKPLGFRFRRQQPFSSYILDFYCHSLKLAIEVDGSVHEMEEAKKSDRVRQRQLEQKGLTVLRFTNQQIKEAPEEIFKHLESYLRSKTGLK